MSNPLTIPILIDPDAEPGTRYQLDIDGSLQNDLIWARLPTSLHGLFGQGNPYIIPFGPPGPTDITTTAFGAGTFGRFQERRDHRSLALFDNGPHTVRLRALDPAGNTSDWSTPISIFQAEPPPPPRNFTLTGDPGQESLAFTHP
ncbi:MAG: hypothetical protein AAF750_15560 [Planctomycetota bacterium]